VDLAAGFKAALDGHRQQDVADAVGVRQNTVSRWNTGRSLPRDLDTIEAVERACGRPPGFILAVALGLQVTTVEEAIAMDPMLSDFGRRVVLSTYLAALKPE
jgi:transcriptional regulator with XRE-family HTH domain